MIEFRRKEIEMFKEDRDENKEYMVTTIDNPFNPFTQFREWYEFDTEKGYDTCSYLSRLIKSSPFLSEKDQNLAQEQAIDSIVELNVLGIYKKVSEDDYKTK